jgi:UDP-3-O-[3-hydroxymyristoyl] glucosamine N-acyltransferase
MLGLGVGVGVGVCVGLGVTITGGCVKLGGVGAAETSTGTPALPTSKAAAIVTTG